MDPIIIGDNGSNNNLSYRGARASSIAASDLSERTFGRISPANLSPQSNSDSRHQRMANNNELGGDEDRLTNEDFEIWLQANAPKQDRRDNRFSQFQSSTAATFDATQKRNLPVALPDRSLKSYVFKDLFLRPGIDVELLDGTYLRIITIVQSSRSFEVSLRGRLFRRTSQMDGVLERKLNEVCWILHIDQDDRRDRKVQGMVTVPISQVIKRRKVRLTNQPFPNLSFRQEDIHTDIINIRNDRVLVCRWVSTSYYRCGSIREDNLDLWCERSIEQIPTEDCDQWSGSPNKSCAVDERDLKHNWRGSTPNRGTTYKLSGDIHLVPPNRHDSKRHYSQIIDLTKVDAIQRHFSSKVISSSTAPSHTISMLEKLTKHKRQKVSATKSVNSISRRPTYTFGDCFCGAGGMSRSAVLADLQVKWAFDFHKHACESYRLNFSQADCQNSWAHDFANSDLTNREVDICHLSPPCQYFSTAHTKDGKDDEMNIASLFAVGQLIKKSKPRIVVVEQTFGILMRERHQNYLNSLLQMFTSNGFNVRWKLIHCADFGAPQMRLRTFIIASCPGERLPPFPQPTHSSNHLATGLKPWTTVNQAISNIPYGSADHNIAGAKRRNGMPEDGNWLARTITTGGGLKHPSGTRDMTIRELACVQTFPIEHRFSKHGAKKQIGNAVPPLVGSAILKEIKNSLLKADGWL
ncbi:MAG: hypothetical protein LQ342_002875 [Letrouitia transgressa]|nr:MAG: hypothetical protein LQ342_002875 [Letrouitia transgressa]